VSDHDRSRFAARQHADGVGDQLMVSWLSAAGVGAAITPLVGRDGVEPAAASAGI
jgi:hypothetical protein